MNRWSYRNTFVFFNTCVHYPCFIRLFGFLALPTAFSIILILDFEVTDSNRHPFTVVWLCSYKDRCVCRTPKRLIEVLFRWSTIWIDRLLLCNIYSAFASFFLLTNPSVTKLFAAFVTYTPSVRYTLSSPFLRVYRLQPLTKFFLAAKKLSTVKSNRSSISCFTNTWYALYLILSLCFFSNSFPLSRKRLVKKVSMVRFLEKSFVVMIVVYVLLEEISHGSIVLPPPRFNLVR